MTRKDEWRRQRAQILSLSAYDRHKQLVNDYMLFFPGATKLILQVISDSFLSGVHNNILGNILPKSP